MPKPIIFYDIPGNVRGKLEAWSPNTWKTRFCLNIKGIPYKTVWVEYPDIEPLCKKLGLQPVEQWPDGSPIYTLPVISDPNTDTVLIDSAPIARYLDKTYPDGPRLIPADADALIAAFEDAFWGAFPRGSIAPLVYPAVYWHTLREKSKPYFRRTRENIGVNLAERTPEERVQHWALLQKGMHKVAEWLEADGAKKLLFMGDEVGITYADIIIAGLFMWFKKPFGEESQEWKDMLSWDDGRWGRFMAAFEKYEAVDEGEDLDV
ncbi:hypothetical protein C8Q80DRAFT_1247739 [Daedaleopsis nitida]|nr:hypothetical protein C8Q80DRAFT_1247739 [Daedaleopsis nitida]